MTGLALRRRCLGQEAALLSYFLGGTETTVGGDRIHTFRGDGTLTKVGPDPIDAWVLVLAGGGGGGYGQTNRGAGGGGGGGCVEDTSVALSSTETVTVGTGGAGGSAVGQAPNGGGSSIGAVVTASGGGGGGTSSGANGGTGGGGGANSSASPGGTGIAGQGFDGGDSTTTGVTSRGGGGGGGAGGLGGDATTPAAGSGGAGHASSITGSSVNYGGGGGGGAHAGARGLGTDGGGNGKLGDTTAGSAGENGRGGGGGGAAGGSSGNDIAYRGGSGIVIVRYPAVGPAVGNLDALVTEAKFDGATFFASLAGADTTTAGTDLSGNGRHLSPGGGVSMFADAPVDGQSSCVAFDGVDGRMVGASITRPTLGSWEAWIRKHPSQAFEGSHIICRGDNADGFSSRTFLVSVGSTTVSIRRFAGTDNTVYTANLASGTLDDGLWHHIVWTYFAGTGGFVAYVDGVPLTPVNTTGVLNNMPDPVWVGSLSPNVTPASILLACVAEYPIILSADRVAAHYAASVGG